ncbi:hypothetical protein HTG_11655 [Natrinema mahii]|nr:hypothetical protein HTG_11655 [Natrinema mahii]
MVGPKDEHDTANDAFDVLSHHRRRYALQCLREYETPLALADLADEVAVREHDRPLPEIPSEAVKRIYVSLYHTHVPKLADADHVRYSQERDEVALLDHAAQLEQLRRYLATERSTANCSRSN